MAHLAGPRNGAVRRAPAAALLNKHHLQLLARADPEEARRRVKTAAMGGGDPGAAPLFLLSVERGWVDPVARQAEVKELLAWLEIEIERGALRS